MPGMTSASDGAKHDEEVAHAAVEVQKEGGLPELSAAAKAGEVQEGREHQLQQLGVVNSWGISEGVGGDAEVAEAIAASEVAKKEALLWNGNLALNLLRLQLRVKKVPAEGNCFYLSALDMLPVPVAGGHAGLRDAVCNRVASSEGEERDSYEALCDRPNGPKQRMPKRYATNIEFLALSRMIEVTLHVVNGMTRDLGL